MSAFFQVGMPFLANGSVSLISGNCTCSVSVTPNGTEIIVSALTAHPLALSTGARLRRRNFIQAIIILGPLITKRMQTRISRYCHQAKPFIPAATSTKAVPIMPKAIPMAAKIPANLAISNACFLGAFGSAAASALVFMSSNAFASFSAADLLIFS